MVTTWNSADKSANITLSGGDLIATTTSSGQGAVRATTSVPSGKVYYECTFTGSPGGNATGIGWANATAGLSSFIGTDKNGVANYTQVNNGQIVFNSTNLGLGAGPGVPNATICVAADFTAMLLWVRLGNGVWNRSGTADPGTGTGGINISGLNAGPYFPAFCCNSSGQVVTANFGATDFAFAVPTGFAGIDTNTQAFNASSKFEGLGPLSPPQTAASSSKFGGLGPLAPTQNAAVSSKFVAYGILLSTTSSPAVGDITLDIAVAGVGTSGSSHANVTLNIDVAGVGAQKNASAGAISLNIDVAGVSNTAPIIIIDNHDGGLSDVDVKRKWRGWKDAFERQYAFERRQGLRKGYERFVEGKVDPVKRRPWTPPEPLPAVNPTPVTQEGLPDMARLLSIQQDQRRKKILEDDERLMELL